MKTNPIMPQWIYDHVAVSEEMSDTQVINMIGQNAGSNLKTALKADKQKKDELQQALKNIVNPMKLQNGEEKPTLIWLVKQVDNGSINIDRIAEDAQQIQKDLTLYFKYRREFKKKLTEYTYSSLKRDISDILGDEADGEQAQTLTDFLMHPLAESGVLRLYKVEDQDIAMQIGQGTSWCTQGDYYSSKYLKQGPLFVVYKKRKRWAQLHFPSEQFMDVRDNDLSREMIDEIREAFGDILVEESDNAPSAIIFAMNPTHEQKMEIIDRRDKEIIKALTFTEEDNREIAKKIVENDDDGKRGGFTLAATDNGFEIRYPSLRSLIDKFNIDERDAENEGISQYDIEKAVAPFFELGEVFDEKAPSRKYDADPFDYLDEDAGKLLDEVFSQLKIDDSVNTWSDLRRYSDDESKQTLVGLFKEALQKSRSIEPLSDVFEIIDDAVSYYKKEDGSYALTIPYKPWRNQELIFAQMYLYGVSSVFDYSPFYPEHSYPSAEGDDWADDYEAWEERRRMYFSFYFECPHSHKYTIRDADKWLGNAFEESFNESVKEVLSTFLHKRSPLQRRVDEKENGQQFMFEHYLARAEKILNRGKRK